MNQVLQQLMNINDPEKVMDLMAFEHVFPAHLYWKDCNGKYIGCNNLMARDTGHTTVTDLIGQDDFYLCTSDSAMILKENDSKIRANEKCLSLAEQVTLCNGAQYNFISHKTPLRSRHNKIIGIIGISFKLEDAENCYESYTSIDANVHYYINNTFSTFSPREAECLNLLIKGLSTKQIAHRMKISPRTAEDHINRIKHKTKSKTKLELIAKTLSRRSIYDASRNNI